MCCAIAGPAPRRREASPLRAPLKPPPPLAQSAWLDLHDDRQNHGPALRPVVQERGDAGVDGVFQRGRLREMLAGLGLGEALQDPLLGELDELTGVLLRHEALVTMS